MPYKVVIADKVDLIRDIYEKAIEQSEGYTLAASFCKPAQAVAYLMNNSVDIMVMNLIPGSGMNGIEAAQKIKVLKPEVKIIVTAVLPNAEDVTQAQKAAPVGIYKKLTLRKACKYAILQINKWMMKCPERRENRTEKQKIPCLQIYLRYRSTAISFLRSFILK